MAKIYGDNTSEIINGTISGDTIYAGGGNDVLKGGGGADKLYGGSGNDTADYSDSSVGVEVSLAAGRGSHGTAEGDQLYEIENLTGSDYNDTLQGDENANTLNGGGGDDILKGGGGADKLFGGAGNDQINSDGYGDQIDGGSGIDTANFSEAVNGVSVWLGDNGGFYNAGPYYVPKPVGTPYNIVDIENVYGSNNRDDLRGNSKDNILDGAGGHDRISGGGGNDTIIGGVGDDWLTGGADSDTFVFARNLGGAIDIGEDHITDFNPGQDHIKIDDSIFADFGAVQSHMQQVGNDVVITIDADNSITMQNVTIGSLGANDFLFV